MRWIAAGEDGFTLIETVAVLLILGLVSAAAVPALGSVLEGGGDEPARDLAELFRGARESAASRGAPVVVTVDPRSGAWRVFHAEGSGEPLDRGTLAGGRDVRLATPGGEPVIARFDPSGRARAPTVTVGSGPETRRVEVDPWTASVRVR